MTRQAGRAVASQYLGVAMTATAVEESLYIPPTLSLASGWGDEDHADDRSVFARYDIGEPATVFSLTGNREVRLTREPPIVTFDPMRAYGWGRLRFGGRGFVILHAPLALSDTPHWLAARVDRELTDEGTGLGGEEVAVAGEDMVRFGTQGGGTETTSWATGFPRTGSVPPYYDTLEVIAAVTSSGALLFPNAAVASRYLEDARREPLALHLITEHRARELVLAPIDAATGERRRVLIADAGAEAFALAVPQARVEYLAEMIVGATQGPEERAIVRLLMAIPGEGEPAATLAALQTAEPELYAQLFTDLGSNLWELAVQVGERRAGAPGSTGGLGQVLAGLVTQLLLQRFDPDGVALGDSGLTLRIRSGLVDRPGELPVVLPDTVDQLWTAAETAVDAIVGQIEGVLGNPFEMLQAILQAIELAWTVEVATDLSLPVSAETRAAAWRELAEVGRMIEAIAGHVATGLAGIEYLGVAPGLAHRLRCRALWEILLAIVNPETAVAGVRGIASEAASLARIARALAT